MNKRKIVAFLSFIIGLLITSVAFNLFFSPNNFVTGGVSGLAIIVRSLFNINESLFMMIMNIFLIIVSYICLGKEKTKNTILGALLFPVFVYLTQNMTSYFTLTIDPILISVIGGSLSGFGYGIIFRSNYTTGGTDILNQMMEKYFKIPMSKSILYVDGTIVLMGCAIFGLNKMIYSLIALSLISIISNRTQLGINQNRVLYINSKKQAKITTFLKSLHYDVTILHKVGGYTSKKGKIIMTSIEVKDYYFIKEGIKELDPDAFFFVANAYEQKNANIKIRESL